MKEINKNEQTGLLIKQLNDKLEKQANNQLRETGLTFMQMSTLITLEESPGNKLTMKQLEKHFSVSQPTIAGIVKRLESKKLIESMTDPDDKRVKIVTITEEGRDCFKVAASHMNQAEISLLKGFSEEETETFHRLLRKATDNIEV